MNDFKAFLLGTTNTQRLVGGAAAVILAAALLYLLAYKPQQKQIQVELANNTNLKQQLSAKETQIDDLRGKVLGGLDVTEQNRRDLRVRLNTLFTKKTAGKFLDVEIYKLAEESGLSDFHAQAPDAAAQPALITAGDPARRFRAYRKSADISFVADFQQAADFMQTLFLENRYMAVTHVSMASIDFTKDLQVELTLELYSEDAP